MVVCLSVLSVTDVLWLNVQDRPEVAIDHIRHIYCISRDKKSHLMVDPP